MINTNVRPSAHEAHPAAVENNVLPRRARSAALDTVDTSTILRRVVKRPCLEHGLSEHPGITRAKRLRTGLSAAQFQFRSDSSALDQLLNAAATHEAQDTYNAEAGPQLRNRGPQREAPAEHVAMSGAELQARAQAVRQAIGSAYNVTNSHANGERLVQAVNARHPGKSEGRESEAPGSLVPADCPPPPRGRHQPCHGGQCFEEPARRVRTLVAT